MSDDCPNDLHLCFDPGWCERNGCHRADATPVPGWNDKERRGAERAVVRLREAAAVVNRLAAKVDALGLSPAALELGVARATISKVGESVDAALKAFDAGAIRR